MMGPFQMWSGIFGDTVTHSETQRCLQPLNMNIISVLSILGLLLATARAQKPQHCVSPPLMSGGVSVLGPDGLFTSFTSTGTISYDAFGQKVRVRSFGLVGNETVTVDQLMLFNKKIYYEIDWSKLSCKKRHLSTDFIPMQVPDDAKLMGQAVLGSSSSWGMGVLVNTWYGTLPGNGTYMSVFTEIGCIPMTFTGFTPTSGWTTISTFNWVLGITNPMDFFPPFFCAMSHLEDSEAPDTMFTALESLARKTENMK
ncbi:ependymin-2-like [Syngnathoides biaculeatus]|uniref:ependymin-2-like n=1 Tax=Syngnathoides biaculeatus TaxID=300417 RepID=UPI002ADD5445|nr:ependymin-2-like [Syngnathoides biaculeatus]